MGRMNSIQRISAQSLMMQHSPRGKNAHEKSPDKSLTDLLREHRQTTTPSRRTTPPPIVSPLCSPTAEKKQEPLVMEEQEMENEMLSSDHTPTAQREATDDGTIPMEIIVIGESPGVKDAADGYRAIGGADIMKLEEAPQVEQYETREHVQQLLEASKEEIETLSKYIKKSKKRVQALVIHNTAMLDKLKAIAKRDEAIVDTHTSLKQEITLLKACLFLSMIFVMCGGRPEFIALLVFGWAFADLFV